MGTAFRRAMVAACWGLVCGAVQAAPSIADFAAGGEFGSLAMSPDGKKVAYATRVENTPVLVVFDLETRNTRPLMPAIADGFEVSWCGFKSDERLLCGFRGVEMHVGDAYPISRMVALDVTGKQKPKVLIQNSILGGSQFQDRVLDWQVNDSKRVLIQLATHNAPFPDVHALDIYTGYTSVVQRNRTPILGWAADREGVVRFGAGFSPKRSTYITRDSAKDPWRTLAKWELGESEFAVVGFGVMPGTLLVEDVHNGRNAIFEMDLTENSDRQLLFSHPQVDVDGPIYWPVDRRIIGFQYETDKPQRKLFDAQAEEHYKTLDELLPDAYNSIIDGSRDGQKLLVASRADVRPTDFLILDLAAGKLRRLGNDNPALAGTPLSPMKPIRIKGPDGLILPGYLTLPQGSDGKHLPMVVYPHGGPYARDSWGFDPMVQLMASRGYAVLQVNFRGSTGFGAEWFEAGLRNWGTVMVDDITIATRWAIGAGIADPKRVCIVGWSFGGYAALMSAVRESGLYRCVASIAGVSDLRALATQEKRFYGGRFRADNSIGTDADELKAGSPMRAPEKFRAPVLLIHGDHDVQVSHTHSERMAKALEKAGKAHELLIIKDGNHSLTRHEWREALYTKLERFLSQNL